MLDNQVRLRGAQLVQGVVAGEHGTGMNAAVPGGLDVVLHIAHEQGFVRAQAVFGEDGVDFFALVPNADVRLVEKSVEAGEATLGGEIITVDGAQEEGAEIAGAAELEKVAGVGEGADGVLGQAETGVEPGFELGHGHMGSMALVKIGERQGKFRAKLLERHFLLAGLREDKIGGLQDGGQIVHQRARPVEDDIVNHGAKLTTKEPRNKAAF